MCGAQKDAPETPEPPCIKFGVRGDNFFQLRHESGSKYAKKWRNFKADFENELYDSFGDSYVDHELCVGQGADTIKHVTQSIVASEEFSILIVGIAIPELCGSDPTTGRWSVLPEYPAHLDDDLRSMSAAIQIKSPGSLILVGAPAEIWGFGPQLDAYLGHARNTLRDTGLQVIPKEAAAPLFIGHDAPMKMSSDGTHLRNDDDAKTAFVKAFAAWLILASSDATFGRCREEEVALPKAAPPQAAPAAGFKLIPRARSRSPWRTPVPKLNTGFVPPAAAGSWNNASASAAPPAAAAWAKGAGAAAPSRQKSAAEELQEWMNLGFS